MQPGYYDDATALTAVSGCGMTVVFAPGTYWFDFHNAEVSGATTAVPTGSDVWTVNNRSTYIIGGTAAGWSNGPPPTFPGACVSPLLNQTAQGVRFVGIDSLNIDDTADPSRPAHTKLLGAGIPICEHMTNLAEVPASGGRLHAVPIAWVGGASFPVRAYVIPTR